jgi:hypothetical protein
LKQAEDEVNGRQQHLAVSTTTSSHDAAIKDLLDAMIEATRVPRRDNPAMKKFKHMFHQAQSKSRFLVGHGPCASTISPGDVSGIALILSLQSFA